MNYDFILVFFKSYYHYLLIFRALGCIHSPRLAYLVLKLEKLLLMDIIEPEVRYAGQKAWTRAVRIWCYAGRTWTRGPDFATKDEFFYYFRVILVMDLIDWSRIWDQETGWMNLSLFSVCVAVIKMLCKSIDAIDISTIDPQGKISNRNKKILQNGSMRMMMMIHFHLNLIA